mgnify:CR=1 FL=1
MKQPTKETLEKDIEWFCESLGLLGERDKQKTGLKVFKAVLNEVNRDNEISAEDIANKIKMSRTAVMYHLNMMLEAGMLRRDGCMFELRTINLQKLVDEIERDIERTFHLIREIAEDIDKSMKLPVRNTKNYQAKPINC